MPSKFQQLWLNSPVNSQSRKIVVQTSPRHHGIAATPNDVVMELYVSLVLVINLSLLESFNLRGLNTLDRFSAILH